LQDILTERQVYTLIEAFAVLKEWVPLYPVKEIQGHGTWRSA